METESKERMHSLVDALPAGELHAAERFLEFLSGHERSFGRALQDASALTELLSDGDRKALDEGRRALETGDVVSDAELRAELGS